MSSRILKRQGVEKSTLAVHTFPDSSRFSGFSASEDILSEGEPAFTLQEHQLEDTPASQPLVFMGVSEEEATQRESKAYQSGFQEAEMRAKQVLARQEENAAKAIERSILEMQRYQKRLAEECERQVARLAVEVAKKIVHHDVRIDSQIFMAMIRVALEHVADARKVRVKVHPADLANLQKSGSHGSSVDSSGFPMEWVSDPGMERGGFIIESDMGNVDGRLSQQFQEIEKSFFGEKQ
jgi:flagellar assembly protein FliH